MVYASPLAFMNRFLSWGTEEPTTDSADPSRRPQVDLSEEMRDLIRVRHRAHKTPIAAQAARAFTWQRDRSTVITKAHEGVTDTHKQALSTFETVFLPGFYNHPPGENWFNKFAAASARASVISVSRHDRIVERDLFHIVGGDDAAYHPEWANELPTVICRLFVDLQMNTNSRKNRKLLLIGHSKGGLLVYTLLALRKHYEETSGHYSPEVLRFFPGLADVPPYVIEAVMTALEGAIGIALATPFFGLHPVLYDFIKKYRLDKISYNAPYFYSEKYLESLYTILGQPENFVHGVVHAKSDTHDLAHLAHHHTDKEALLAFAREPIVQGGRLLFDVLAATVMPEIPNDGIVVNPPLGLFSHELSLNGVNHIEIVVDDKLALRKLDFVVSIISDRTNLP